jgi:lipopolysaccharide assembly outer membrane protein LptD (OstA)
LIALWLAASLLAAEPPVSIEADSSVYRAETKELLLRGNVVVTRSATEADSAITLRADAIEGRVDGTMEAEGNVRINYGEIEAAAARGAYDFAIGTGSFEGVEVVHDSWFIDAAEIQIRGPREFVIEDCNVTACDAKPPHYRFRVGRATFRDGVLSARNTRLYIGRVPVMWLPFFALTPGAPRPPLSIAGGKSDYEGYFVKLGYRYAFGGAGDGTLKVDWRSHRGWGYGVEHRIGWKTGAADLDLYRIDERDRGGRGVARVRGSQDFGPRVRALGDIHYVTDGRFLQDYRFNEYASKPDPQSTGSLTYRGDASAVMLRVVQNSQKNGYDLIERLPELRAMLLPRAILTRLYLDASGGVTAFRHTNPYDSGVASLFARQHPGQLHQISLVRGDANVTLRRPTPLGNWIVTPYGSVDFVGYADDTSSFGGSTSQILPAAGLSIARFLRWDLSERTSFSMRPLLDISDRSIQRRAPVRSVIIEHIDQRRDQRPLRLVLDQGLLRKRGGRWSERLRLRLDGGYDFDRVAAEKYLPAQAKIVAFFGDAFSFDGSLIYDPNQRVMREARAELVYAGERIRASAGYYLRRGDAGLRDFENVGGAVEARFAGVWRASAGGSYDVERRRLDYARYGLSREFHDWILGAEVTDQRAVDRFDVKMTAELKLP